jgi:hypothetical protein
MIKSANTMAALNTNPRAGEKVYAGAAPPSHPAREVRRYGLVEAAFGLPASFVGGMIEVAKAEALHSEYVNGVLAAFQYLHSPGGEKEALELLKRRRKDR